MQTSTYFLAAGVLAAVILPLQVQGGPDTEEQAKLREALRRAIEQPNAPQTPPAAVPPPAEQPAAQPQAQPAAVTPVAPPPVTSNVVASTPQTFEPVPPPDDAASIARAREAMREKMKQLETTPAPATATTPAPAVAAVTPPAPKPTAQPDPKPAPVAAATYKPIDAPPSPFSAAKQAKLAELLTRYRADAITAQEYHAQRAAIIAEP